MRSRTSRFSCWLEPCRSHPRESAPVMLSPSSFLVAMPRPERRQMPLRQQLSAGPFLSPSSKWFSLRSFSPWLGGYCEMRKSCAPPRRRWLPRKSSDGRIWTIMPTYVHPSALVEEGSHVGEGSKIWHYVHIRRDARIGTNCILGRGVFLDEGVQIGNSVKIQNYVSVFHGVTICDGVFVGPHVCFT